MFADDDAEIAHVMFVGTTERYAFTTDELLDHIDMIEVYRVADPLPEFDPS
jgi:hypothetical protein